MRETVLITGGSGGLGFALARVFAAQGNALVLVSANAGRLQAAKARLESEFSAAEIRCIVKDLAQPQGAEQLADTLQTEGISVDVLVNNAGTGFVGPSETLSPEEEQRMLWLNVYTPVALCKRLLPGMYEKHRGKILNISSVGAFQPGPYTATYFAAKAYLLSYSRAIRLEAAAQGVQVCALCPGSIRTEFFNRAGAKTPRMAMPPEKVAAYACRRLLKNKAVSIPGILNRVMQLAPAGLKSRVIAAVKRNSLKPTNATEK